MIITLIGYMGSGKSLIGKTLATSLSATFLDLDTLIEQHEQRLIKEIFATKGEIYFREVERKVLLSTLTRQENIILSLGGGTPCFYNNMEEINAKSQSIYLQTSIKTLAERLAPEKDKRPIIAHLNEEQLQEFIAKHLFERRPFYEKAQHIVKTDDKTAEEIVAEIVGKL